MLSLAMAATGSDIRDLSAQEIAEGVVRLAAAEAMTEGGNDLAADAAGLAMEGEAEAQAAAELAGAAHGAMRAGVAQTAEGGRPRSGGRWGSRGQIARALDQSQKPTGERNGVSLCDLRGRSQVRGFLSLDSTPGYVQRRVWRQLVPAVARHHLPSVHDADVGGSRSPGVGLNGFDWLWMFLAVVIDVSTLGSSGYANRDRMPMYNDTNP